MCFRQYYDYYLDHPEVCSHPHWFSQQKIHLGKVLQLLSILPTQSSTKS